MPLAICTGLFLVLYIIFCVDLSDLVKNCSKGNMVGIFMKMKF